MYSAIIKGLALGIVLSVSVGPVIFAIIKYSLNNGFKAGISFALGVSMSDILFVLAGNIASSFISGMEQYNRSIGFGGGILLIGMGLYGLRFKKVKIVTGDERPEMFRTSDYAKIWTAGFLMNTLNPGVILFWLPVTIANIGETFSHRLVLYGTALGMVLSFDILKVFIADKIRHKLTLTTVGWLNRIAAVCMIIFGLVLLLRSIFNLEFSSH